MSSISKAVIDRSNTLPEGGVLSPKDFLHLGSRAAVDQAFSRLAKAGRLLRVARGIYVAPVLRQGKFCSPEAGKVMKSIAAQGRQVIEGSGAQAAKKLGLTRVSPALTEYLTSGRSKRLIFENEEVPLKHVPYWMLSLGSSGAGNAVRALAWMGHEHAESAALRLRKRLSRQEWDTLARVRASLPSWMASAIGNATVVDVRNRR